MAQSGALMGKRGGGVLKMSAPSASWESTLYERKAGTSDVK